MCLGHLGCSGKHRVVDGMLFVCKYQFPPNKTKEIASLTIYLVLCSWADLRLIYHSCAKKFFN